MYVYMYSRWIESLEGLIDVVVFSVGGIYCYPERETCNSGIV